MFKNKKNLITLKYIILFFMAMTVVVFFIQTAKLNDLLASMENRTFDLRQNVIVNSGSKKPSKDIVLVTIDDASYEYLLGKYGEWPIPRNINAQLIDYLEKQKPTAIVFDFMFVKSIKSKGNADLALANAMKKNKNVYTSMNFDNQAFDVRKPVKLDKKFTIEVKNDSKIDFVNNLTFNNCRAILPQILEGTSNVGIINVFRSNDGILRKVPSFMIYQGAFYPHLAFMVGNKYLQATENFTTKVFHVNKHKNIELGKRIVPIDSDGGTILNWYGPARVTFQEVPLYKIIKAINHEGTVDFDFKNKIVYIGATAISLYDTKSVPIDKLYPGVEVHATYVNNLIDNNFIKKVDESVNIVISLILALIIGIVVVRATSTAVALGTLIFTTFGYIILTYYLMKFFNLWLGIVLPVLCALFVFIVAYIIKYLLKSKAFEHQYKLATTDGLTELFNHRYFQEQMIQQIANSKRYNSVFSVIIVDIDFFKKFNDVFGHQSGDAVLRQVARKLKKNVRATDFVCRYGGEEMSIILPSTDKDEAIITAQKICQAVAAKPFKLLGGKESSVTISLGVATYPEDGKTPTELIEKADKGLYQAKEAGRNRVGL